MSKGMPDDTQTKSSTAILTTLFSQLGISAPELLKKAQIIVDDNRERYNQGDYSILLVGNVNVLSAMFPNVDIAYSTSHYSLNLSSIIGAHSASNKSLLKYCLMLMKTVDDYVIDQQKKAHQGWENKFAIFDAHRKQMLKDGKPIDESLDPGPEPKIGCFHIPLNVSKSMLVDLCKANEKDGNIIAGTELATFMDANGKKYGQMEDTLNTLLVNEDTDKAFRIDGAPSKVEDPKVTFIATGTPEHVHGFITNFTTGIGSRIYVYMLFGKPERDGYKDQRPKDLTVNYADIYKEFSKEVFDMWKYFHDFKFTITLTESQWDKHYEVCSNDFIDIHDYDSDLLAIAKRAPQLIVKVAALHHMLRLWDEAKKDFDAFEMKYPKQEHHYIYCDDEDFTFGLEYEQVMLEHTMKFATSKVKPEIPDVKPVENWKWYYQVLDKMADSFTIEQFAAVASLPPYYKKQKTCYTQLKSLSKGAMKLVRKTKEKMNGKCVYVKVHPKK